MSIDMHGLIAIQLMCWCNLYVAIDRWSILYGDNSMVYIFAYVRKEAMVFLGSRLFNGLQL